MAKNPNKKSRSRPLALTHNPLYEILNAVSFISATLGEDFTAATADELCWSAGARDHEHGYPVSLTFESDKLTLGVSFEKAPDEAIPKLYAIIGYGHYRGHEIEAD
jgi:hypothetical protein